MIIKESVFEVHLTVCAFIQVCVGGVGCGVWGGGGGVGSGGGGGGVCVGGGGGGGEVKMMVI